LRKVIDMAEELTHPGPAQTIPDRVGCLRAALLDHPDHRRLLAGLWPGQAVADQAAATDFDDYWNDFHDWDDFHDWNQ
jgi:hypothetical protein